MGCRKVLITGVSKGLGRALALELASRGHTVIGCSRDQTKLDTLQTELLSKSSSSLNLQHFLFKLDVTSNDNVREFAQIVLQKNLVPDIIVACHMTDEILLGKSTLLGILYIVNNAAVAHRPAKLWELEVEEFDKVLDINIKGTANIIRNFIPLMIPNNNGVIVNMSSTAGRNAYADFAAYCSSKWGVEGMSKSIAKEVPEGLTIVALDPGIIHTDMLALCVGDLAAQFQSPQNWAIKAATMILDLTPKDNGESLTVQDPREIVE